MDQLVVDIDGLRKFSTTLKEISEAMWAAPGWLNGDIGEPQVDKAIEHFESDWSDGRVKVQENCKKLGDIADDAAQRFTEADEELDRTLREFREKK